MDIEKLVKLINNGELAIVPTDTVYGIIGDATNEETIHKVYEVKKRSYSKPLIIMVSGIDMVNEYVQGINDLEKELIEKYWPGKLTILLHRNNKISDFITNGGELVGIICPDNKDLIELINRVNKPLIGTSANISEEQTITNVNMLDEEIISKISYIYDGGEIGNKSSTIVKVEDNQVRILRAGELAEEIRNQYI